MESMTLAIGLRSLLFVVECTRNQCLWMTGILLLSQKKKELFQILIQFLQMIWMLTSSTSTFLMTVTSLIKPFREKEVQVIYGEPKIGLAIPESVHR